VSIYGNFGTGIANFMNVLMIDMAGPAHGLRMLEIVNFQD
jgi:hypothetical protein